MFLSASGVNPPRCSIIVIISIGPPKAKIPGFTTLPDTVTRWLLIELYKLIFLKSISSNNVISFSSEVASFSSINIFDQD